MEILELNGLTWEFIIFSFLVGFYTNSSYAGLCDKEKRERIEATKNFFKASDLMIRRFNMAVIIIRITTDETIRKNYEKIAYSKKCKDLLSIQNRAAKKNASSYEFKKALKNYENQCGKKLQSILFKISKNYKKAYVMSEKATKKLREAERNLNLCINIRSL